MRTADAAFSLELHNRWRVECVAYFHASGAKCRQHGPLGGCRRRHTRRLLWVEDRPNLITTVGKNKVLDATFKTGIAAPAWYVGLVDNASFSAYAAADTSASHAGWIEGTPYSNATRVAFTAGTIAAGSVDNSASVAAFTINATLTVRGMFLIDQSTKGGSTGTLYGEVDFSASKAVESGDVLNVTVTITD